MIEITLHDRNTGEMRESHVFKTNVKAQKFINKFHETPGPNQLRLKTIDSPKDKSLIKMLIISVTIALTVAGIRYLILHKWG